jgi:hypothetical protein
MAREKVLVFGHDINILSKIYLALIHRKYKPEACNNSQELPDRLKRFRPSVIVLESNEYDILREKLKIPAIVIVEQNYTERPNDGDILLEKPIQIDALMKAVESLV